MHGRALVPDMVELDDARGEHGLNGVRLLSAGESASSAPSTRVAMTSLTSAHLLKARSSLRLAHLGFGHLDSTALSVNMMAASFCSSRSEGITEDPHCAGR